jgi:cysteinyl-tRNA synthetase
MIKIYDSNTQIKQNLDEKNEISIYNCGPTVYNDVHIGNIRPPITFDVLVRFLRYKGDRVKYVMNLTDIDDKIIKKAKEENKNELEVSEFYSQAYIKLLKDLNILMPDIMPKVSESIEEIIDFTKALLDKNKGYVADDGDVYFDIDTVKDTYGEISKQDINELQNESRKELKNNKHNPIDFVL